MIEGNACALCDRECAYLDDACTCPDVRESVRYCTVGDDT